MRKIIYLLALVFLTGVVFISCDRDDDSEPTEKQLIPIKITEYEDGIFDGEVLIEYNSENKVVKTDYGDGYFETYEYDSEGRIIKVKIYDENILYAFNIFEYNSSNQIIKVIYQTPSGVVQSYYVHEYDINGNVIKKTQYGSDDTIDSYYTFSYDMNGNMINQKYFWPDYQTGEFSTGEYEEWTYTYDDKNNIFKSVGMPFLWESHVNNPLTVTITEHYGDNYTDTYNYTYVYNEENYPVEYTEDVDEKYIIEYKEI